MLYSVDTIKAKLEDLNRQLGECTSDFSYWQIIREIMYWEDQLKEKEVN